MGGFNSKLETSVEYDAVLITVRKLCGNEIIPLNSSYWTNDMTLFASELQNLGNKLTDLEEEMLELCDSFVLNNVKATTPVYVIKNYIKLKINWIAVKYVKIFIYGVEVKDSNLTLWEISETIGILRKKLTIYYSYKYKVFL